jgi:hypothetical protein
MRTIPMLTAIPLAYAVLPLAHGQEPEALVPRTHATTQPAGTDPICELLFSEYVQKQGHYPEEWHAAVCLIAARGRAHNGFWREVRDTYRTAADPVAERCVLILGKMLAVDAHGREIVAEEKRTSRRYEGAWAGPYIVLPDEVVDLIVGRALQSSGPSRRAHLLALVQSADPRAIPVFAQVLGPGATVNEENMLLAAIGLANLGQERGVEWLIEHCELDRWFGLPPATIGNTRSPWLDEPCQTALRLLSGHHVRRDSSANWQQWWQTAPRPFVPVATVDVDDR